MDIQAEEQEIREFYNNWIKATTEGDLELAHRCIADDARFLVAGAGEMNKVAFAQAAAGVSPEESPMDFHLESDLLEIKVLGEYAYILVESKLAIKPKEGDGPTTKMAGHSLAVLHKRDGRWQNYRDASTLVPIPAAE